MKEALTFDDVLIVPQFSDIESRKDVSISSNPPGMPYMRLPVISANMDTVTGSTMAKAMLNYGANAVLHRFCTIEENVKMFLDSRTGGTGNVEVPLVSIGLGNGELERAEALYNAGALAVVIDVAHGATMSVVKQVKELQNILKTNGRIIVGNFAGQRSVKDFLSAAGYVDGIKVGVGPGAACTTRIQTGVGYPQLSAIMEISILGKLRGFSVIADGGLKKPGDIAKALGAGADAVMVGSMLAGTDETPGEIFYKYDGAEEVLSKESYDDGIASGYLNEGWKGFKKYRGSASQESYQAQGKVGDHRTTEGDSFLIPYKGPVSNILQDIEGGLRSSFSYVGARNLKEFQDRVEFVRVSSNTVIENGPHGKK